MERDRKNPGPQGRSRRVVAWLLIVALATLPLTYLAGSAGPELAVALVLVAVLVGGVAFGLHRAVRR